MDNHHAILLFSDSIAESVIPEIFKTEAPDIVHISRERFSIDDARELTRQVQLQPFEGSSRVFVIFVREIAVDAQNALLKLFEEPPKPVQFYVVVRRSTYILPTLLSRLSIEAIHTEAKDVDTEDFIFFINASYKDRLARIAEMTKAKDTQWIERVVSGCEAYASQKPQERREILEKVLFVRTYIGTKGSSAKMLLEELALSLPIL